MLEAFFAGSVIEQEGVEVGKHRFGPGGGCGKFQHGVLFMKLRQAILKGLIVMELFERSNEGARLRPLG